MGRCGVFLGNGGNSEGSKPKVCCTELGREGEVGSMRMTLIGGRCGPGSC